MPSSTHTTGSSSLARAQSPASDPGGSDNPEDQVDAGVWKRRYFVLQESVNAQTASKRKAG